LTEKSLFAAEHGPQVPLQGAFGSKEVYGLARRKGTPATGTGDPKRRDERSRPMNAPHCDREKGRRKPFLKGGKKGTMSTSSLGRSHFGPGKKKKMLYYAARRGQ